jgi:hypothetical protein
LEQKKESTFYDKTSIININKVKETDLILELPKATITPKLELLTLIDLLKYLSQNNEYSLFYYLLNKVEIIKYEMGNIEMKSANINKALNNDLKQFLYQHTAIEWNITANNDNISASSLKEMLALNAIKKPIWNNVIEKFPAAKITDILLKK